MSAKKVLFITQEITPYVPESELAIIGQNLPQAIQLPVGKFTSSTMMIISSTV